MNLWMVYTSNMNGFEEVEKMVEGEYTLDRWTRLLEICKKGLQKKTSTAALDPRHLKVEVAD